MRRTFIFALMLLLIAGVSAPAYSEGENCGCSFTVKNPNHTQELGGKSGHSSHGGLHKAAENSEKVIHTHKP